MLHVSPPGVVAVHASPSTSFAADTVIAIAALADTSRVIKNDADAVTARDGVALTEKTNSAFGEFTVIAIAAVAVAASRCVAVAEAVNAVAAEALPLLRAEALDAAVIAIDGVADADIVTPARADAVMAVAAGVPNDDKLSRLVGIASRLLESASSCSRVGLAR